MRADGPAGGEGGPAGETQTRLAGHGLQLSLRYGF